MPAPGELGAVMNRFKLGAAFVGAVLLAIPALNFVSTMVIFPILIYAVFALVANLAPPVLAAGYGLRALGFDFAMTRLRNAWVYCTILWIGCAYGLSHWGDAARSMGGKNIPYLKVLFAPYLMALGIPVE